MNDFHDLITDAEVIKRSLISTGNNFRILQAMKKARRGDKVTIAYLGASITFPLKVSWNNCYATLSYHYFKELFTASDKIEYVNAGMNGTSSTIGLIRAKRDILQYQPDIIFVEFAVNDSKDSVSREVYECLILQLLNADTKPAVILLFMTSESGYSCQGQMQAVGEYYHLPMISIMDALMPEIINKRFYWSHFSNDNIHPNEYGNLLIAEFIKYYYYRVMNEEEEQDIEIPGRPFYGNSFINMKLLDSQNAELISMGSFKASDTIKEFKNGWVHNQKSGNDSLIMRLTCKSLFVIFKESNEITEGNAQIIIDGIISATLSGYRMFGWNNPTVRLVLRDEETLERVIEVKMENGSENKNFSLLAFGYCV
ncbi:SGNH/GDSL hydrolase family protein [Mobilitalea sibirica]|uniref:SGNH/GDSL hydrolase family protein n=1 Tax=Mobilitalea sibirica TaxID=1462919 RepID=A0A8J7H0E4_9FIRM|nr:SGNH/GDSL hydrolase family protein [Mobilitalea sibirica]MBH1939539.1 SGNH/GDSL hydrolase family protein [Mobilitalea sibirica]